jgi:tRNA threonylcarbamoyladenosine biosynthesis protein TsaE
MKVWLTEDEEQTRSLAHRLSTAAARDESFLLFGPMGSGKTVFAQGLAAGRGIDPREVQSPTFTVAREHGVGDTRVLHLDVYRLEPEQLPGIGIDEMLAGPGLKIVEWADRLPDELRGEGRHFYFRVLEDGRRSIRELSATCESQEGRAE